MVNDSKLKTNKSNNRLYLDVIKGIAIFLMLWGHCVQYCSNNEFDFFENGVFKFIYSFHMPLFMLVSGYLFFFSCRKREFTKLIIHRTQSMLQPIIMCSVFNYFLTVVISKRTLGSMLDGPWISNFSSLWFLWSVLSASLVVTIANYSTTNKILRILILVSGTIFVCLFPNYEMNLYMYPYFVLGFFFAKYKDRVPKSFINIKYFSLIAFPIMLLLYEKKHYIYTTGIISSDNIIEMIKIDGFRWMIGLAGSVFVLVVIEWLFKVWIDKRTAFVKPIARLGEKSLQMYCISVSVLSYWLPELFAKLCNVLGGNVFAKNTVVYNFLFTPFVALCFAVLIYFIVVLLEKIKLSRILFGR